jgi:putative transcription factor
MICEVCGEHITKGFKVKLEGGVVTACLKCSELGEVVKKISGKKTSKKPAGVVRKMEVDFDVDGTEELVEDYAVKIRKAREKEGLKQEELARMINEPSSLIHRIESGRIQPSPMVARKIQKKLNLRLLVPHTEANKVRPQSVDSKPLTLGDMVVVKKKR